jgi:hypothetical protein
VHAVTLEQLQGSSAIKLLGNAGNGKDNHRAAHVVEMFISAPFSSLATA